jgi:aspartate aminotransferase
MLREYARRREYLVTALNAIPGIHCKWPDGAFYVYPNVSAFLGNSTIRKSTFHTPSDFSHRLLQDVRVAVVPGEAFGTQEHIRISYASSREQIEEGLRRLKEFCRGL